QVMQLDPDLGFIFDPDATLSASDVLAGGTRGQDVVINQNHIYGRVLVAENNVSICRALVGTPYLSLGSLVVRLCGNHKGAVVAHVGPGAYLSAEQASRDGIVNLKIEVPPSFDLADTLRDLCSRTIVTVPVPEKSLPNEQELKTFFTNPDKLIVARQKQIM